MTPSIDQALHQFANLLPNWTLLPILTLLPNFGGFHWTLQRVWLANRGRLLLRTPGPVPFGTCICSNVETILSWTCHVYGPFEFRTSLGTSILLSVLCQVGRFTFAFCNQFPMIFLSFGIFSFDRTIFFSSIIPGSRDIVQVVQTIQIDLRKFRFTAPGSNLAFVLKNIAHNFYNVQKGHFIQFYKIIQ